MEFHEREAKQMLKRFLQRLVIKWYEKLGCREMDPTLFWTYHLFYSVPKDLDSKVVIAEINRINGEIQYVGDWTRENGFFIK
jgi:hypothetical protein